MMCGCKIRISFLYSAIKAKKLQGVKKSVFQEEHLLGQNREVYRAETVDSRIHFLGKSH